MRYLTYIQQSICSLIFIPLIISAEEQLEGKESSIQLVEVTSTRDPQWMSYRKAYDSLEWLENYQKTKNFIRLTFQLWPKDQNEPIDNVRLELVGEKTRLVIPLEPGLHATIPKIEEAYKENAEFRINRRAGTYLFQNTGSIKLNADGIYPLVDLRTACDQLLTMFKDGSVKYRLEYLGKKCVGVQMVFTKKQTAPEVYFKDQQSNFHKIDNFSANKKKVEIDLKFEFPEKGDTGILVINNQTLPTMITGLFE